MERTEEASLPAALDPDSGRGSAAFMQEAELEHPRTAEPKTLTLILILSAVGAIVGMEIMATLGVTPNTSIVGALVAITLGRLPLRWLKHYRSIHVQNLAQSAISAATFGAANSLLLPIGIPYALGRPDLILPMFLGAAAAMLIDALMLYRMFGTRIFPASGAWPFGTAAGEAIRAGDEGGSKAIMLGLGAAIGAAGSWLGIPMSAFGIAFVGNVFALSMFGLGLLVRGYSKWLFSAAPFQTLFPHGDLNSALLPHGFMIGAGLMALIQVASSLYRPAPAAERGAAGPWRLSHTLGGGFLCYVLIAMLIAGVGGLFTGLSVMRLLAFVLYAAFAAFLHELIVGLAAMHSGWFPAFAVALITLLIGMLMGFPQSSLALLVGFSAATGPAFADMGYDLKAGFLLRGSGRRPGFEMQGRHQQLLAALAAFAVAILMVALSWHGFFQRNLLPPLDRVYAATIQAGLSGPTRRDLILWAIPGALLQWVGGKERQLGILFATGLLIGSVYAGWAVLIGIIIRIIWSRLNGSRDPTPMQVFGGGVIAGDALLSFASAVGVNFSRGAPRTHP
jgi:uncharacterized oligopeptide transporter (OPT) family protein